MTGEASAPVGPQIQEERIVCRNRGDAGLECPDAPAGVIIDFKLRNDRWRRLGALVGVFVTAHLLRLADRPCRPISRLGGVNVADILCQGE